MRKRGRRPNRSQCSCFLHKSLWTSGMISHVYSKDVCVCVLCFFLPMNSQFNYKSRRMFFYIPEYLGSGTSCWCGLPIHDISQVNFWEHKKQEFKGPRCVCCLPTSYGFLDLCLLSLEVKGHVVWWLRLRPQIKKPRFKSWLSLSSCVMLRTLKDLNFLIYKHREKNGTYFIGLWREVNRLTYVECLEQYLTQTEHWVLPNYYSYLKSFCQPNIFMKSCANNFSVNCILCRNTVRRSGYLKEGIGNALNSEKTLRPYDTSPILSEWEAMPITLQYLISGPCNQWISLSPTTFIYISDTGLGWGWGTRLRQKPLPH